MVGWLVCIRGEYYGDQFRLKSGRCRARLHLVCQSFQGRPRKASRRRKERRAHAGGRKQARDFPARAQALHGRTLRQLVGQEGPLPLDRALYIIQSAGSALERIHTDIGIFHRDISPENIMLCDGGSVKLIDFGSAKDLSRRTNQQFTIVLKAGYAPPEQYSATAPQGRCSDVYALAGTLYYLLTRSNIPQQRGSQAAIGGPPLPAACEEARGSQIQYRPTPLQNPRYTRDLRRCAAHP